MKDSTVWQSKLHGDSGRYLGLETRTRHKQIKERVWTGYQLDRAQGLE